MFLDKDRVLSSSWSGINRVSTSEDIDSWAFGGQMSLTSSRRPKVRHDLAESFQLLPKVVYQVGRARDAKPVSTLKRSWGVHTGTALSRVNYSITCGDHIKQLHTASAPTICHPGSVFRMELSSLVFSCLSFHVPCCQTP
jgi:hypothetical protein